MCAPVYKFHRNFSFLNLCCHFTHFIVVYLQSYYAKSMQFVIQSVYVVRDYPESICKVKAWAEISIKTSKALLLNSSEWIWFFKQSLNVREMVEFFLMIFSVRVGKSFFSFLWHYSTYRHQISTKPYFFLPDLSLISK